MATVKLQNGRVILKNNRVSCTCCEEDVCFYPALGIQQGTMIESDLLDEIKLDGVTYARNGTSYGNTTNGVIYENGVWAVYKNGVRSTQGQLHGNGVEDLLADTYVVNIAADSEDCFFYGAVTVTRTELTRWVGYMPCGEEVTLDYNGIDVPVAGQPCRVADWVVGYYVTDKPGEPCVCSISLGATRNDSPTQGLGSSPIGTYQTGGEGRAISVS